MEKIKEGKFSLEEAQSILGSCYLGTVPEYAEVFCKYQSYGYVVDRTPHYRKEKVGEIKVWQTPAGLYVEADI